MKPSSIFNILQCSLLLLMVSCSVGSGNKPNSQLSDNLQQASYNGLFADSTTSKSINKIEYHQLTLNEESEIVESKSIQSHQFAILGAKNVRYKISSLDNINESEQYSHVIDTTGESNNILNFPKYMGDDSKHDNYKLLLAQDFMNSAGGYESGDTCTRTQGFNLNKYPKDFANCTPNKLSLVATGNLTLNIGDESYSFSKFSFGIGKMTGLDYESTPPDEVFDSKLINSKVISNSLESKESMLSLVSVDDTQTQLDVPIIISTNPNTEDNLQINAESSFTLPNGMTVNSQVCWLNQPGLGNNGYESNLYNTTIQQTNSVDFSTINNHNLQPLTSYEVIPVAAPGAVVVGLVPLLVAGAAVYGIYELVHSNDPHYKQQFLNQFTYLDLSTTKMNPGGSMYNNKMCYYSNLNPNDLRQAITKRTIYSPLASQDRFRQLFGGDILAKQIQILYVPAVIINPPMPHIDPPMPIVRRIVLILTSPIWGGGYIIYRGIRSIFDDDSLVGIHAIVTGVGVYTAEGGVGGFIYNYLTYSRNNKNHFWIGNPNLLPQNLNNNSNVVFANHQILSDMGRDSCKQVTKNGISLPKLDCFDDNGKFVSFTFIGPNIVTVDNNPLNAISDGIVVKDTNYLSNTSNGLIIQNTNKNPLLLIGYIPNLITNNIPGQNTFNELQSQICSLDNNHYNIPCASWDHGSNKISISITGENNHTLWINKINCGKVNLAYQGQVVACSNYVNDYMHANKIGLNKDYNFNNMTIYYLSSDINDLDCTVIKNVYECLDGTTIKLLAANYTASPSRNILGYFSPLDSSHKDFHIYFSDQQFKLINGYGAFYMHAPGDIWDGGGGDNGNIYPLLADKYGHYFYINRQVNRDSLHIFSYHLKLNLECVANDITCKEMPGISHPSGFSKIQFTNADGTAATYVLDGGDTGKYGQKAYLRAVSD